MITTATFSGAGVAGTAGAGSSASNYAQGSLLAINITSASTSDLATLQAGVVS